jgi:hypothetical protein
VIDRNNWSFNITANDTETSVLLYSLVQTAIANGLISYDYITDSLAHFTHNPENIEVILPWNVKLGSVCLP